MVTLLFFSVLLYFAGVVVVASNPSPLFGALGLVGVTLGGSFILMCHGGGFLSLVVLLIYLGGMLVVFAYGCSFSLSRDDFLISNVLNSSYVFFSAYLLLGVMIVPRYWWLSWGALEEISSCCESRGDFVGAGNLYGGGGMMLLAGAWALLLTLLIVMEVSRGGTRGVLRA